MPKDTNALTRKLRRSAPPERAACLHAAAVIHHPVRISTRPLHLSGSDIRETLQHTEAFQLLWSLDVDCVHHCLSSFVIVLRTFCRTNQKVVPRRQRTN